MNLPRSAAPSLRASLLISGVAHALVILWMLTIVTPPEDARSTPQLRVTILVPLPAPPIEPVRIQRTASRPSSVRPVVPRMPPAFTSRLPDVSNVPRAAAELPPAPSVNPDLLPEQEPEIHLPTAAPAPPLRTDNLAAAAILVPDPARTQASVRPAGFGEATVRPLVVAPTPRSSPLPAPTPVEILFKPRPVYTEEARRLHIEGEVQLEIVFNSAGETRVVRIVRGLGHGLDESAVAAARHIRFRPAQRGGQPEDSSAIVHIQFQLAY